MSISISSSSARPPQPRLPAPAAGAGAGCFLARGGSGCFITSELPACWRIVAHGLARNAGCARIWGARRASACLRGGGCEEGQSEACSARGKRLGGDAHCLAARLCAHRLALAFANLAVRRGRGRRRHLCLAVLVLAGFAARALVLVAVPLLIVVVGVRGRRCRRRRRGRRREREREGRERAARKLRLDLAFGAAGGRGRERVGRGRGGFRVEAWRAQRRREGVSAQSCAVRRAGRQGAAESTHGRAAPRA